MKRYYYFDGVALARCISNGLDYFFEIDTESPEYRFLKNTLSVIFIPEEPPEKRFVSAYNAETHKFSLPILTATDFLKNYQNIDRIKNLGLDKPATVADELGRNHFYDRPTDYIIKLVD